MVILFIWFVCSPGDEMGEERLTGTALRDGLDSDGELEGVVSDVSAEV